LRRKHTKKRILPGPSYLKNCVERVAFLKAGVAEEGGGWIGTKPLLHNALIKENNRGATQGTLILRQKRKKIMDLSIKDGYYWKISRGRIEKRKGRGIKGGDPIIISNLDAPLWINAVEALSDPPRSSKKKGTKKTKE